MSCQANAEQQQKLLADGEGLRQWLPADETICFDGIHPTHNLQPALWMNQKRG